MALRDQPYLPLYVQDFLTDEKLAECSAKSTGVYVRLMCIMHKSEEYGKILLRQKDRQTDQQIKNFAAKIAKQMPYSEDVILASLQELIDENVLYIDGDYLVQKRMVKDNSISELRSLAGKKGAEETNKKFATPKTRKRAAAKKPPKSESEIDNEIVLKLCIGYWTKEVHPDWIFEDVHGLKMKSIIEKLVKVMKKGGKEITNTTVYDSFVFMCQNLPEWYQGKDLKTIDSGFNEVIEKIKNKKPKNGIDKTRSAAEQAVANIIANG